MDGSPSRPSPSTSTASLPGDDLRIAEVPSTSLRAEGVATPIKICGDELKGPEEYVKSSSPRLKHSTAALESEDVAQLRAESKMDGDLSCHRPFSSVTKDEMRNDFAITAHSDTLHTSEERKVSDDKVQVAGKRREVSARNVGVGGDLQRKDECEIQASKSKSPQEVLSTEGSISDQNSGHAIAPPSTKTSGRWWMILNAWTWVVMSTAWEGVLLFIAYLCIRWVPKLRGQAVILLSSSLFVFTREIMLLFGHTLTRAWIWRDLVKYNYFELRGSQLRPLLPDLLSFLSVLLFLFVLPLFHIFAIQARFQEIGTGKDLPTMLELYIVLQLHSGFFLLDYWTKIIMKIKSEIADFSIRWRKVSQNLSEATQEPGSADAVDEEAAKDCNEDHGPTPVDEVRNSTGTDLSPDGFLSPDGCLGNYHFVNYYIIKKYLLDRTHDNRTGNDNPEGTSDQKNDTRRRELRHIGLQPILRFMIEGLGGPLTGRGVLLWDVFWFFWTLCEAWFMGIIASVVLFVIMALFSIVYAFAIFFTGRHITVGVIVVLEIVSTYRQIDLGKGFYEFAVGMCFIIPYLMWINYLLLLYFIKFILATSSLMKKPDEHLVRLSKLFYAVPVNPSQALTKISDNAFGNYARHADRNPKLFFISVEEDKLQCQVVDVEEREKYMEAITTSVPDRSTGNENV